MFGLIDKAANHLVENWKTVWRENKPFVFTYGIVVVSLAFIAASLLYSNRIEGYKEEDKRKTEQIADYRYELDSIQSGNKDNNRSSQVLSWPNLTVKENWVPQRILKSGDYQIDIRGEKNGTTVEFYAGFDDKSLDKIQDKIEHMFILKLAKDSWIKPALKDASDKTQLSVSLRQM